jgi:hypothetical protein
MSKMIDIDQKAPIIFLHILDILKKFPYPETYNTYVFTSGEYDSNQTRFESLQ